MSKKTAVVILACLPFIACEKSISNKKAKTPHTVLVKGFSASDNKPVPAKTLELERQLSQLVQNWESQSQRKHHYLGNWNIYITQPDVSNPAVVMLSVYKGAMDKQKFITNKLLPLHENRTNLNAAHIFAIVKQLILEVNKHEILLATISPAGAPFCATFFCNKTLKIISLDIRIFTFLCKP